MSETWIEIAALKEFIKELYMQALSNRVDPNNWAMEKAREILRGGQR